MPTDILCAHNADVTSGLVKWNNSKVDIDYMDYVFNTPNQLIDFLNNNWFSKKWKVYENFNEYVFMCF